MPSWRARVALPSAARVDRMARALVVVALLSLVSTAAAHGVLQRTEPRGGSTLKSAPTQVRLEFTGAIEPAYSPVSYTHLTLPTIYSV